nr:sulfatase-modifying factor protein [uncultured bacterium]
MKKIYVILALIICSCSTSPKYLSFDNALEAGIQKIGNDLPEGTQVAILDFKSDNENLSSYIIEEMYDKLVNFKKLAIMERSRTNTIAMEVGYQLSGEVDDNQIINIGKQLGADYVVTGQIIFSGEAYRLRVFAIDIEKGRRVASSSLNINQNDRQITYLLGNRTETVANTSSNQNPLIGGYWVYEEWLLGKGGDDVGLIFYPNNTVLMGDGFASGEPYGMMGTYDDISIYSDGESVKYRLIEGKLYIYSGFIPDIYVKIEKL